MFIIKTIILTHTNTQTHKYMTKHKQNAFMSDPVMIPRIP